MEEDYNLSGTRLKLIFLSCCLSSIFSAAPDPDTVIRSLINLERSSALQDSRIKQQFSTIPNEVWNVQAVEKITDRKRLESLLKSVDSSYDLISEHRIKLQVIMSMYILS